MAMCSLCFCFECRQCPEYTVAASRVVNYCAGDSNMYSSSFSIPLPQGGSQTSARRHGKKGTRCLQLWIHCVRFDTSSWQLARHFGLSQSLTVCAHSSRLHVCTRSGLTVTVLHPLQTPCKYWPSQSDLMTPLYSECIHFRTLLLFYICSHNLTETLLIID